MILDYFKWAFKLFYYFLLLTSCIVKTKRKKKYLFESLKVIIISKLNISIVFSCAIFWGPTTDEMGTEGRGTQTPVCVP